MRPDEFILGALRASILISPRDHGLTHDEIMEAGKRFGFKPGELSDGFRTANVTATFGQPRLRVTKLRAAGFCSDFNFGMEPEYRDLAAFDFVRRELQELAREVGEAKAKLARDVLVARGVSAGLKRDGLEVAITMMCMDDILVEEKDGMIGHARHRLGWILPSEQAKTQGRMGHASKDEPLTQALSIVQDIIARRSDGRPSAAEPLDAFESMLTDLGHDRFRAWWVQERNELKLADLSRQPVSALIHAAALAEAALAFVVPRAKSAGLMKSIDVSKPRQWRFADLVKGAKSSDASVSAILDERSAQRGLDLNDARQRIHAGYLIDTIPSGPIADLKPEQARDAVQTLEILVRRILEWLDAQKQATAGTTGPQS